MWQKLYLPTTNAQRHGYVWKYVSVGDGFSTGLPSRGPRKDIKVQKNAMEAFEKKVMTFPFWTKAQELRESIEAMDKATFPSVHVYRKLMYSLCLGTTRPSVRIKRNGEWFDMPLLNADISLIEANAFSDLIRTNYWFTSRTNRLESLCPSDKAIIKFPGLGCIMQPMGEDLLWEPLQRIVVFTAKKH